MNLWFLGHFPCLIILTAILGLFGPRPGHDENHEFPILYTQKPRARRDPFFTKSGHPPGLKVDSDQDFDPFVAKTARFQEIIKPLNLLILTLPGGDQWLRA